MIQVTIKSLFIRGPETHSTCVLVPVTKDDTRQVPIEIGGWEAAAIAEGIEAPITGQRPLTHDLCLTFLKELNTQVSSVYITRTEGPVFFAEIELMKFDGSTIKIDARPSDAIALAVRSQVPIFMDDEVLESASLPDFNAAEQSAKQENMEEFHKFIEDISPDDF